MFFDELAGGERLERGAGQVKICPRGDWQKLGFTFRQDAQIFVHVLKVSGIFEACFLLGYGGILALKQLLGCLAPRTEMVFVENDQIPIGRMHPFVTGLDIARLVAA